MIDDDTRDRAEIYDLFNRYVDAVAGRQWELLDEVFTEDVTGTWLEPPEIEGRDGDAAEASVRIRVYPVCIESPGMQYPKIFGSFRARLVRTRKGWRFRDFGPALCAVT